MNLYMTTGSSDAGAEVTVKWDGTQADAGKTRKALKEQGLENVETKDMDVPTNKDGLLKFLNQYEVGK